MRQEIIGDCRLILGDSLDVISKIDSFEVMITDPVWPNCPADLIQGSEDPWGLWENFCSHLYAKGMRQMVVVMRNDSDPRFLKYVPDYLPFQQLACLQYVMPSYLGRVLGGYETAYAFGSPVKSAPGRRVIPSLTTKAQPSARPPNGHPCSRTQAHSDWLVNWFSDEGETIIDPFMGSGTTGVSAVRKGRKFIGIEIEEKYFDIACRRIEQARRVPDQTALVFQEEDQAEMEMS